MNKADRLAIEYRTANYRRRSEILKRLYKINAGLMNIIARPVFYHEQDDFYSAMRIRFIKAIETFNPKKGGFYLHLKWQLRGERHEFCRKNHMVQKGEFVYSLDQPIISSDDNPHPPTFLDSLKSKENTQYEHSPLSIIKPLIPKKDLEIIKTWQTALGMVKYARTYGVQKIAGNLLGISGEAFRQRFNRIILKIQGQIKLQSFKYH